MNRDPKCKMCKLNQTAQYVCLLGYGQAPSKTIIIGEAPGRREDESGRPFVGKAGQLLRSILESHGINDHNSYITNAVGCRPPDNRTPTKSEINSCRVWLTYQIREVRPKFVLILGNVALQGVLQQKGVTAKRGKPFEQDGKIYLITFHPSAILRNPNKREALEADIRLFAEIVKSEKIPTVEGLSPLIVNDRRTLEMMFNDFKGAISFDIETSCLYPWAPEAEIRALGFGTRRNQWIIPCKPGETAWSKGSLKGIVSTLGEKLKDHELIAHNGKFDLLWMRVHFDARWELSFDTMLAHYLLDENKPHGLKYLAQVYFGALDYAIDPRTCDFQKLVEYLAKDLFYTRRLKLLFEKKLHREGDVKEVFEKIMMPCSSLFTDIEHEGIYIDLPKMGEAEVYLNSEISVSEKKLKRYGNEKTNWRSTKQLANILFGELGLSSLDTTKGGVPSTNESVLKRLDHPIIEALLQYRAANQQMSFFIDGWKPFLVEHRLHPSFKLHGAVTGRLSCEHPNLQQVPRDSRIRSLVIAPPGWTLVEFDLSQIELRIAAELSGERTMLETFKNGEDIHWKTTMRELARGGGKVELIIETAKAIAKKPVAYEEAIRLLEKAGPKKAIEINPDWKEVRKKSKAINFGYLYGMYPKKFMIYARDNYGVTVSLKQAKESRAAYFDLYSGLIDWHERQKRYARRHGYVVTLSGRKRRLPEAQLPDDTHERRAAERQAINSPVQGFASELNLMAALEARAEFQPYIFQIVGTVHDSILAEVKTSQVQIVVNKMLSIMSHPKLLDRMGIKIKVPIEAEASIGPWGAGKGLEEWLSSR